MKTSFCKDVSHLRFVVHGTQQTIGILEAFAKPIQVDPLRSRHITMCWRTLRLDHFDDCLVIFGSAFDPTLEGSLRVSIVATGLCERSRLNKDQQESETNIKSKLNFALEPKPQPELEPELDLERTSKASKQPIDPVMEPETETIIEPASNKASDKTQTNLTNKPIPTPTVPRPENPRPVGTPTPHATHQNTMNKQPEEKHSETVLHDEPKVAEKKKPKLSWTKKIFGSD